MSHESAMPPKAGPASPNDPLPIAIYPPVLFELGDVVATPPALRLIEKRGGNVLDLLRRHQRCEWDAMCAEDRDANWQAALSGESRIFSSFDIGNEGDPAVVWVITEWDRSVTTVLLPSCY